MRRWKNWLLWFVLQFLPTVLYCYIAKYCNFTVGVILASLTWIAGFLFLRGRIYQDVDKLIRRKIGIEHESGLPMAEWEERQRMKAMDEKLSGGRYTDAEKEHLIYTADLTLENKDALRHKHIPYKSEK